MTDTPNDILNDNLFFLSSAYSRKLSSEADETFATFGLASSHALILQIVGDEPGIQPGQLAEKLHLKPSTITRLVQKLERRELVKRTSEGRATSIRCTTEGAELVGEIESRWQKLMDQKREELGERYVEVLSEMIFNALEAMDSEQGQ